MSSWTTTVPNSVRKSDPVGQTSRQPASVQCLQTSELINQRKPSPSECGSSPRSTGCCRAASWTQESGAASATLPTSTRCSMKATWRQRLAPSCVELSYDVPVNPCGSSGTSFHSLQATSHALHPMQTEVSVKKPTRSRASSPYVDGQAGVSITFAVTAFTCYLLPARRRP